MRKIMAVIMVLTMVFALSACKSEKDTGNVLGEFNEGSTIQQENTEVVDNLPKLPGTAESVVVN